jgi:hypothetical protein
MEPTQQPPDHGQSTPGTREPSVTKSSGFFSRTRDLGPNVRVILGVAIVAALVLLAIAFDAGVSLPAVCDACHEMRPWVAGWRVSPHAKVGCSSCHGTPRPWYGAPVSAFERWGMLGRDLSAHVAGRSQEATNGADVAPTIPDSTCLQCHDAARVGTSRFGVQIKHAEHAARNKSCVSCHRWTAHPPANSDRDVLMMQQCFSCHSLSKGAKASGECGVCHLKGLDLRPASHKIGDWLTRHGPIAKVDHKPCALCHREDFCRGCHGLEMPHAPDWARVQSSHAAVARKDHRVCARCHSGTDDVCAKCHRKGYDHHRTYDPNKGPWVAQHSAGATRTGAPICYECHEAAFCVPCHGAAPGLATGGTSKR